jgi:hypothetical protein
MVDEEFTDAEIRELLRKVAADRRRDETRRRLERAGDPQTRSETETPSETPDETPLAKPAA